MSLPLIALILALAPAVSECFHVAIRAVIMLVAGIAAIATRCSERRAASITVLEILSRQVKSQPEEQAGARPDEIGQAEDRQAVTFTVAD